MQDTYATRLTKLYWETHTNRNYWTYETGMDAISMG